LKTIEASYRLTAVQHGMLFHWLRDGAHTGVDLEQMVLTMREDVDSDALRCAWARIAERHPVLRTCFRWAGLEDPLQDVMASVDLPFVVQDLQGVSDVEVGARVAEVLRADRERGFELDVAPLARLALLHLGPADHRLVWTFSHAILDGGSFAMVVNEAFAVYEALRRGHDVLCALPRAYADHVAWVHADVTEKKPRAAAFWRTMLAGFAVPTPLPRSEPENGPPRGPHLLGEEETWLSRGETDALRGLASAQGVTLATCVQGAWALVLAAHSGEDDVVFGATRACRRTGLPEAPGMVGIFINTLPVRVRLRDGASVSQLLRDVRLADASVREFEHTPLAEVQSYGETSKERALFDSLVVFNESLLNTTLRTQGGAWAGREVRFLEQTGYALSLFAYAEAELLLKLSYDRARFDSATATRILAGLRAALVAMALDPRVDAKAIACLSDAERHTVLVEWNDTDAPPLGAYLVHELIEQQVARSPEATAVAFRGSSITYCELDARAALLAHKLRTMGVGPDILVGICAERSIEMVVGLLGIMKAGGAYVPIDPRYPKQRIAWLLEDAKPLVLVTQSRLVASLPAHAATVVLLDDLERTPNGAAAPAPARPGPDNLAYVVFTSGSTGRPKGVLVRHRNVTSFFQGMDERIGGDGPGVWLAVTSISFDISVLELFWTLARGFEVVVQEEAGRSSAASSGTVAATCARPVAFSLFYFAAEAPSAGGQKYRLLLEGARFADENGFAAVWTPERHFHAFGGLYPNPSVTSAAIAAITKRIHIRAGSIVLPLHNAIRVAEEWSVVDNLSGGRVGLSFASGWHADDFALAPDSYADRREILVRGIDTVRRLWRGEAVAAKSGSGSDVAVRMFPAPVQKDPPIWLAAAGNPDTFALAGRLGASVLTNMLGQSMAELRTKIAGYRAARRAAGHAGEGHVTLMLHAFVGDDLEAVRETVRKPFIEYLKLSADLVKRARWEFPAFAQPGKERAGDAASAAEERELTPLELDAMMDHTFERYFRTSGLFGTPDTCLPMVEALSGVGVDEIACLVDFGVETDVVLESLLHLNRLRERSGALPAKLDDGEWDVPAQIRRYGVTHLQCTPSRVAALVASDEGLAALAPLRKLLLGGEALPRALAARLAKGLEGDVVNLYGPTETTVWSTTSLVDKGGGPVVIGRPIANTKLYVLDARGSPVPIGAPGELFIGGAGVAGGYLDRPELTAARFVPNPFSADAASRLYRTGDIVRYRADGDVDFLGRADHQVKIRGHRVELGEIEAVLGEHPRVHESVAVALQGAHGDQRIVAYVVARESGSGASASTACAWRRVWDGTYEQERPREPTFDTAGWNDSATGEPLPEPDMREWVEHTAARVLALQPARVLEIGCGTGLLLFRLAHHVAAYTASDVSPVALRLIEAELPRQNLSNVALREACAEDFQGIAPGSIDTIVINSVIQYFPSIEHLLRVLEDGMRVLAPGGAIFVGDVRSLVLLPEFYTAIELRQARDATPRHELLEAIRRRAVSDPELSVDPAFFEALEWSLPGLSSVSIQLKRGARLNELTRFRFDVVLRKAGGAAATLALADESWVELPPAPSLSALRALLCNEPAVLGVARVPNARTFPDAAAVAMLRDPDGPRTAGELRAALQGVVGGVDPEAVFTIDPRYAVDIAWSAGMTTAFDVVFRHRTKPWPAALQRPPRVAVGSWARFGNHPAPGAMLSGLVAELREYLRARLPEHMLPSVIVRLDVMPRTPNGKIDRKALPAPDRARKDAAASYTAPANDVEAMIAAVWQEVLNLDKVGIHENFFDLGANSLLIMQANGKIRRALGRDVSLVAMFRFTTVSALAAHLVEPAPGEATFQASHDRARTRGEAMQRRRGARETSR
jgi:natural product biosynthesis luciferase-like monooxygenase protein